LARSSPIVLTSPTDASFAVVFSTPPLWHFDAVRGRPPHRFRDLSVAWRDIRVIAGKFDPGGVMRFFVVGVLAAILVPVATSAHSRCQLEAARYALRGEPTITAHFQDIPQAPDWLTNVALNIDFAEEGDGFWWLFDQGSARFLNMISTTDVNKPGWVPPSDTSRERGPLGETHVWFATKDYRLSYRMPKRRQTAPQHIFIPDLEDLMWHTAYPARTAPTGFFDLVSCK
jgi:hypothetical protein